MQAEISSILADLSTCENDSIRGSNTTRLLGLLPQEQLRAATPESTALRRIVLRAAGGVPFLKRSFVNVEMKDGGFERSTDALIGSFLLVSSIIFDQGLLETDSELKTVANDALFSLASVSALGRAPLPLLASGVSAADTILRTDVSSLLETTSLSTILSGLCLSAHYLMASTQYIPTQTCALSCALHVVENYVSMRSLQGTFKTVGKNEGGRLKDKQVLDSVLNESSKVCSSLVSVYSSSRNDGNSSVAQLAGKVLVGLLENVADNAIGGSVSKQLAPSWCFPFRYVLINDISQPDEGRLGDPLVHLPQDEFRSLSLRLVSACIKVFGESWLLSTLPQREGTAPSTAAGGEFALIVSRLIGASIKQTLDEFEMCLILARGTGGFLVPGNNDNVNMTSSTKDEKNPLRGVAPLTRDERTRRILPKYDSFVKLLGASVNAYTSLVLCTAKMSSERSLSNTKTMALMRLYESIREVCGLLLSFLSDAWGSDLRPLLALPAIIPSGIATAAAASTQQHQFSRSYSTDEADTLEELSLPWRVLAVQPLLALCVSGACTYLLEGGAEAFHSELVEALPCMMSERATVATFTGVPYNSVLTSMILPLTTEAAKMTPQQRPNPFSALSSLSDFLRSSNSDSSWRLPLPDIPFLSKSNDTMNATVFNPKHLVIQVIGARLSSKEVSALAFDLQPSSSSNIVSVALDLLLSYCRSISLAFMHVESSAKGGLALTRNLILPALSVSALKTAIGTCQALLDLARTTDGFKQLSSMTNLDQTQASFLITAQRLAGKRSRGYAKDLFLNGSLVDGLQLSLARHLTSMSALSLWPALISAKKSKTLTTPSGVDIAQVSETLRDVAFELFSGVVVFSDSTDGDTMKDEEIKKNELEEEEEEKRINLKLLDCILEIVGTGF